MVHPLIPSGKALTRLFFLLPQLSKCQELIRGYIRLELRGGTLTGTKWLHFMSLLSMLWLWTFQVGLITYVSLLLLTPKSPESAFWSSRQCLPVLGLFLCWIPQSNCWVCGVLPSSSVEGFPWWTSPLQKKDFLQVCEYLQRQSYVMTLLHLMTSNNPKMDWCNTLYFNYGHNETFNFDFNLF